MVPCRRQNFLFLKQNVKVKKHEYDIIATSKKMKSDIIYEKEEEFPSIFPVAPLFLFQNKEFKKKKTRKNPSPFLSHFLLQKKKKERKEEEKKQKKRKKRRKRKKYFILSLSCSLSFPKKKRGEKKKEEKKKKWKKICAFKVISDAKKTSFHLSTKQGLFNFYYSKYLISRIKIFTSDGINQICENNDLYSHSLTIFVSGVYK